MQILIDNLDGSGYVDWTQHIQFGKQAMVNREFNKPTLCHFTCHIETSLDIPAPSARIRIMDCFGQNLFTGFIADTPAIRTLGTNGSGLARVAEIIAVSEEAALDANPLRVEQMLVGQTLQQNWKMLAARAADNAFSITLSEQLGSAGRVLLSPGTRWSSAAGELAGSTRSVYRSLAGSVQVTPVGETVHVVDRNDPGLRFTPVDKTDLHLLAGDFTIIGREEPRAYVTEVFQGDGVTTSFVLSNNPFEPNAKQKSSIRDLFQGTALNRELWSVSDAGGHIALTSGGLSCMGGSGKDGESTVIAVQEIEIGGNLILEADGVQIQASSSGMLLGLYTGTVSLGSCFVGFQVSSAGTSMSVSPVINGVLSGQSYSPSAGHLYIFRIRAYGSEIERVRQTYYYPTDEGTASIGGGVVDSGGWLQFEVQDVTSGALGAPTILFSGSVTSMPPSGVFGLISSGNLAYSIKSVVCTQTGPLWVGISTNGAAPVYQSLGTVVEGAACHVSSVGSVEFYPNSVPSAGTLIYVRYRARGRAVARRTMAEATKQVATKASWVGTVTSPIAWSSFDCEAAAEALVLASASSNVVSKGAYLMVRTSAGQDVWPGDWLNIVQIADGTSINVVVRSVRVSMLGGNPEQWIYEIKFANDWAESLSIHLSPSIPEDAFVPQEATQLRSALPSLNVLAFPQISGTAIQILSGQQAPSGGGFEVRRRDETFGPGSNSDLVLRTATSTFSIPRVSPVEQYYVRMYDGANPPNYSAVSAAVFVNVPLQG